ncbi:MAG: hypothetical protein PHD82_10325, partial [Candidatus Riflebacteria bacterium]|nr:hypothetical protein [Candidatus Riflebacteria bacterium]
TFAGMQGATSVVFNPSDETIGYLTNTNNEIIRFSPIIWDLVPDVLPITQAENITFNGLARIRYSSINTNYGSKVCVADTNNNRVVRFLTTADGKDPLTNSLAVNASSPIDMAFTLNNLITLSNADSKVSVHRITSDTSTHLMDFGKAGNGAGEFNSPISVYFNDKDLFILEATRLQVIRSGQDDWLK